MLITIDEFINIVKKCADSCNEDLCLPEVTKKFFSSFDFTPDNAVELWEVLKPVVEKFHGNAENYYSNLYGLLQEHLLPKKFVGDIKQIFYYQKLGIIFLMHAFVNKESSF